MKNLMYCISNSRSHNTNNPLLIYPKLFKNKKMSLTDKIIEEYITALLDDKEEIEGDPNALSPAIVFQEDTKFINGVKKMPSASRPMKSASLPPMVSEVEIMTDIANCEFSQLYDTKMEYIRVIIPGMSGNYFIKADKLKRWLYHFIEKGRIQLTENGNGLMVEMKVSRDRLLANCEMYYG